MGRKKEVKNAIPKLQKVTSLQSSTGSEINEVSVHSLLSVNTLEGVGQGDLFSIWTQSLYLNETIINVNPT